MGPRLTRRAVAVCAVIAAVVLLAACTNDDEAVTAPRLSERRVTIGGLEVVARPTRLDAGGATFTVAFDTHTGAPTIDVAANARLTVGGAAWEDPSWDGDGPGGHHRAGTLRFRAAGPPQGTARLTISGLDEPVALTWKLSP